MKAHNLLILLVLSGCSTTYTGRDDANAAAQEVKPTPLVTVSVQGGAITGVQAAVGGLPPRVRVRAQSLDVRIEVRDAGCEPSAVTLEVSHLSAGMAASWRPLLNGVLPEVAAAREAAGGAVDFASDPDDRNRTPLAAERVFEPETEGGVRVWTVRTDRSAGRAELLPGVAAAITTGGAGACTTLDAEGAAGLGSAHLVVRHRLRQVVDKPFRFAVFGNNAGHADVRKLITASIEAAAAAEVPERERVLFVVIAGDLTAEGTSAELRNAVNALDAELTVPWYATVGERDLATGLDEGVVARLGLTTFAFDVGATRIMVLDSGDAAFTLSTFNQLGVWLGDTTLAWPNTPPPPNRLLITHTPPFDPHGSRGSGFKSRQDAARLIATLRRAGLPLVITAQFATFERQHVAGVEVVHAGGGGAPMESGSGSGHHWLAVDVGEACQPPRVEGDAVGAACVDATTCGANLWCDAGVCRPCVTVTRMEVD